MKADIINPTKALIVFEKDDELQQLRKSLTYYNKSISFQLGKTMKNKAWMYRNAVTWQQAVSELQSKLKSCLLRQDGEQFWIRPGSIPYLDIDASDVNSNIQYPAFKPIPWLSKPTFDPYPYQSQAVELLIKARHGNISLPTGTGKSFILLLLARNMGLDTVIITPSKSIFNELLTEFQKRLGKKYVGGYGDGKKDIKKKITIAIGRSLSMLKKGSEAYVFFKNKKAILVDESHTFATQELETVCHGVLSTVPYRSFVSATQTRNDGTEKLLQSIIGKTVLEMTLEEAIQDGYLCPLHFSILKTFSSSNQYIKDPITCKRVHFLYNNNVAKLAAKISNASWELKKQSTLILVEELRQISMVIKLLKIPYSYVHSSDKKTSAEWGLEKVKLQEQVDKFNDGSVKVLIGTKAITTGTNIYPTHNTVNWIGGGSEIATKQGPMGRSTRKLEISEYKDLHAPKPYANIFDFDITGQPMLGKQLDKRLVWYGESGGKIKFVSM